MSEFLVDKACIIDDDKLYISLIKMIITKNNLAKELLVFENGEQACDFFKSNLNKENSALPNVVLLDLNMPIMDGWEFLDEMESYAKALLDNKVVINVVSSTINPLEVSKATDHSIVNSFITKPISKNAMIDAFTLQK